MTWPNPTLFLITCAIFHTISDSRIFACLWIHTSEVVKFKGHSTRQARRVFVDPTSKGRKTAAFVRRLTSRRWSEVWRYRNHGHVYRRRSFPNKGQRFAESCNVRLGWKQLPWKWILERPIVLYGRFGRGQLLANPATAKRIHQYAKHLCEQLAHSFSGFWSATYQRLCGEKTQIS